LKLPTGEACIKMYDDVSKEGGGGKDFSSVFDYLSKNKL
jgi:3-hydroxyisobutyrate dehydrogenase-like beta-hydroxyacid dehydrogenase